MTTITLTLSHFSNLLTLLLSPCCPIISFTRFGLYLSVQGSKPPPSDFGVLAGSFPFGWRELGSFPFGWMEVDLVGSFLIWLELGLVMVVGGCFSCFLVAAFPDTCN